MPKHSTVTGPTSKEIETTDWLIEQGRIAMTEIATADQARIDELVTAIAWSLYKPENARRLAKLAVQDTGIGNVKDKVIKPCSYTNSVYRQKMSNTQVVSHHLCSHPDLQTRHLSPTCYFQNSMAICTDKRWRQLWKNQNSLKL